MSFFHRDEKGYTKDKYDNYKNAAEVDKAVENGDLSRYGNGKYAYDRKTGQEYWADGQKR